MGIKVSLYGLLIFPPTLYCKKIPYIRIPLELCPKLWTRKFLPHHARRLSQVLLAVDQRSLPPSTITTSVQRCVQHYGRDCVRQSVAWVSLHQLRLTVTNKTSAQSTMVMSKKSIVHAVVESEAIYSGEATMEV